MKCVGTGEYFKSTGKLIEAQRLKESVEYDLEMIRELGYCNGIENYSRFFDRRQPGTRPFCLLDYFPKDFICALLMKATKLSRRLQVCMVEIEAAN